MRFLTYTAVLVVAAISISVSASASASGAKTHLSPNPSAERPSRARTALTREQAEPYVLGYLLVNASPGGFEIRGVKRTGVRSLRWTVLERGIEDDPLAPLGGNPDTSEFEYTLDTYRNGRGQVVLRTPFE
jgi:hypothetical protein